MFRDISGLVPRDDFIAAMRGVASSVTVVTTDGPAGRLGATVSAFSSVSADPPTVLVCLYATSRIARAVADNERFCVNVLPEDEPWIADRFAGRHDHEVSDRFDAVVCSGKGVPVIEGATGFQCDVQQTIRSGSHLIVIGHVKDVTPAETPPLAYRAGGYHRVVPQDVIAAE